MNKHYIKSAFVALFLSVSLGLYSQTTAFNVAGNPSTNPAIVDLSDASNANLGFLMPNVHLASITDVTTISSAATGLIVWNTNASMPNGVGFYYWSGTNWLYVMNSGTPSVSGSGTANYMARWTAPTTLGTGVAQDNGSGVSISSTALTPANMLDVKGNAAFGTYAGTAAPANGMIVSGQMGIGTIAPNASAALDITSTTGGLLPPRMTTAQITAIATPATGLTILNSTTGCLEYYNGTTWQNMVCPCTGVPNAGGITGSASPCASTPGNIYSIAAVAGATNYTWTVPTGATITAGQNTTSITVTTGTSSGNITVTASNSCGTGTTSTLAVTMATALSNPATPSGTTTPTVSTANTYTIAAVTGATSYTWSVSNSSLASITSGQGTTSVSITSTSTAGTYTICVYASNSCGNTATECLTVTSSTCTIVHGSAVFSYNGSTQYNGTAQTWTVPCGITSVVVYLWGAGGGGDDGNEALGGTGGFVAGTISLGSATSLTLVVGAGGVTGAFGGGLPYGGGGNAAGWGGSGGGRSAIQVVSGTDFVVAGGGGGGGNAYAGPYDYSSGGGATENGSIYTCTLGYGSGATTTTAGAGGTTGSGSGCGGTAGQSGGIPNQWQGGSCPGTTTTSYGGGGGGGYYGGGGAEIGSGTASPTGTNYACGGGGGSNYPTSGTVTSGTTVFTYSTSASGNSAGNSSNSNLYPPNYSTPPYSTYYVSGVGMGGSTVNTSPANTTTGGNGEIVIVY